LGIRITEQGEARYQAMMVEGMERQFPAA